MSSKASKMIKKKKSREPTLSLPACIVGDGMYVSPSSFKVEYGFMSNTGQRVAFMILDVDGVELRMAFKPVNIRGISEELGRFADMIDEQEHKS